MNPLKEKLYDVRVKREVKKALQQSDPRIKHGVGVLYDSLYGRPGTLPSKTTNSIPEWIISNEGIQSLRRLGYDLCSECTGDGWDADHGGIFICTICNGTGIVKVKEV